MTIWLIIGGMTLILFFNRYLFLEPRLPIRLNATRACAKYRHSVGRSVRTS